MSWVKLDDQLHAHRKIQRAWKTRGALGLHLMALSYSGAYDLAGFVPVEFVEEKLPNKRERAAAVTALTFTPAGFTVGLWEPVDGGWHIHDWDEYNGDSKTREQVRAAKSAAGKKGAAARWGAKQTDNTAMAGAMAPAMGGANGTAMAPSPSPLLIAVGSPVVCGRASAARTVPPKDLADEIVGILERGVWGLTTDEPCKQPTRAAVLAALGDANPVRARAAAVDARSIAQSQNKAPNIVGLFAKRLQQSSVVA